MRKQTLIQGAPGAGGARERAQGAEAVFVRKVRGPPRLPRWAEETQEAAQGLSTGGGDHHLR